MKAISRAGKIIFASLIFIMAIFIGNENVFAATKDVLTFTQLEDAVTSAQKGDIINVKKDITVTKTLEVKEDITIKSDDKKTLTAKGLKMDSVEGCNMFYVSGDKELKLENITLDGANKARLIRANGAKINLNSVTMKNGTTEHLEQTASNDQIYSGGAIFAEKASKIVINGGSFENNNTGTQKLAGSRAAEGGAIKITAL